MAASKLTGECVTGAIEPQTRKSAAAGSVDPAEIGRFDALADDWWSPDGPMHALHKMNPVRVRWLCDHMARHFPAADGGRRDPQSDDALKGLKILDIGCGGGILSEALARLGASVTGLEPSAPNLTIAKSHAGDEGVAIDYRPDTAETLAASGASFDVVCAMEVVEHVIDPATFITTASAMVRPGGLLFASTLNRTLKSFALAIIGAEYILRWVPQGTHQWEKFIKPAELQDYIAAAGLKVIDSSGVTYNPLTGRWRTSSDMDINYMFAAHRRR